MLRARCLWAACALLLFVSAVRAQSDYRAAYGARAGYGSITHVGPRGVFDAFYDVRMGSIFFCPELLLYSDSNFAYGMNIKFKKELAASKGVEFFFDTGLQYMVWLDRAHTGIPLDLSMTYALFNGVQLEGLANYTPLFFLGGEPGRGMFNVTAGLRVLVQ